MSTRLEPHGSSSPPAPRTPSRTIALAAVLDVVAVVVFVAIGRRSHDETGSVVAGIAKVAAPFLIALVVGWVVARAWRAPTTLSAIAVIWPITVALGMVLRHTVFDKGTAASFMIVAAIVTFVFLFGWRAIANRVFHAVD
ncbi:MAG: DUF3054 domain-containing protein [Ilumatobacteraceae bacterium]